MFVQILSLGNFGTLLQFYLFVNCVQVPDALQFWYSGIEFVMNLSADSGIEFVMNLSTDCLSKIAFAHQLLGFLLFVNTFGMP